MASMRLHRLLIPDVTAHRDGNQQRAAALAFPVPRTTAQAFGVDPMPFIMAVAYGASACFLIPYGYQTHLMVYSPGRYRMGDFLWVGLSVSLTYSAAVLLLTPLVFPF